MTPGIVEVVTVASMANTMRTWQLGPATDMVVAERRWAGSSVTPGSNGATTPTAARASRRSASSTRARAGQGIGGAMLAWRRRGWWPSRRRCPTADARPRHLASTPWQLTARRRPARRARGWTPRGRGYEMVRPDARRPPRSSAPAGLEIRPVGLDGTEQRIWDAARRGVPRSPRRAGAGRKMDLVRASAIRVGPELWVVAFDGDEIGGVRARP